MSDNQYQSPQTQQSSPLDGEIRRVSAANGVVWIKKAITLFKRNPSAWISCTLVIYFATLAILVLLRFVPFLFPVLFIANSVFTAGIMISCQRLKLYKNFNINHLFSGFEKHLSPLATVGIFYFLGALLCVGFATILTQAMGNEINVEAIKLLQENQNMQVDQEEMEKVIQSLVLTMIIFIGLLIPVLMAFWFAPALIVFKDCNAVDAMKKSFQACSRNILPFIIYGLCLFFGMLSVFIVFKVIGSIGLIVDLALGMTFHLVGLSISLASIYTAYDDIFPSKSLPPEDTASKDSLIA